MTTPRELIERAREAMVIAQAAMRAPLDGWKGEVEAKGLAALNATLADIDTHLSEPQPALAKAKPVAWRHSLTHSLYDTEDEVQLADADSWAEPLYLSPPVALPDGRKALADCERIADAIDPFTRKGPPDHLTMGVAARLLRLAAQPVQEPAGDAQPWRPFGLTLEAALNRGDDPALLMDENSPLRGELRRLLYAPLAPPAAPVEQPAQVPSGWQLVPNTATHNMLNAANAGRKKGRSSSGEIYAAMLAAAPSAQPKETP